MKALQFSFQMGSKICTAIYFKDQPSDFKSSLPNIEAPMKCYVLTYAQIHLLKNASFHLN